MRTLTRLVSFVVKNVQDRASRQFQVIPQTRVEDIDMIVVVTAPQVVFTFGLAEKYLGNTGESWLYSSSLDKTRVGIRYLYGGFKSLWTRANHTHMTDQNVDELG